MKTKSKNFIIPLVVYPFDVMVSFGESDDQLKAAQKKVGSEWDDAMICRGEGRFCMNSLNQSVLRLKRYPSSCKDYGNLQHEIFHAVAFIMFRIGMKLIPMKSDEAYAYLIQYLTTEIYKKI